MIDIDNFRSYYGREYVLPISFTSYLPICYNSNSKNVTFYDDGRIPRAVSKVIEQFLSGTRVALKYSIKDKFYLVAKGFICEFKEADTSYTFIPLMALCKRKNKLSLLIHKDMKVNYLKSLNKKIIEPALSHYDIIWTDNLNKYFCDLDLPEFTSLKERKEFTNQLVTEFIEQ